MMDSGDGIKEIRQGPLIGQASPNARSKKDRKKVRTYSRKNNRLKKEPGQPAETPRELDCYV